MSLKNFLKVLVIYNVIIVGITLDAEKIVGRWWSLLFYSPTYILLVFTIFESKIINEIGTFNFFKPLTRYKKEEEVEDKKPIGFLTSPYFEKKHDKN